jgi:hypothetical protein
MSARTTTQPSTSDAAQLAALYERVRSGIASQSGRSPRTGMRLAVAWIVAPVLSACVLVIASGVVYAQRVAGLEVGAHATLRMLVVLAGAVALAVASSLVATWRGRHGLGAGVVAIALVAALVVPIYALLAVQGPAHAPDPLVASIYISPWGSRCLVISAIVGSGVLAAFVAALRRAVPVASRLRGAALGAAAGAWAGLTVFMFCPSDELQHILMGHVLPIAVFTLAGGIVAPRLLAP